MALMRVHFKHMPRQELNILFAVLSCWAIRQWGSQLVALNGITQSFTLPLTISYAMAAVMTMRSGDFPGFVACPYWTECTKDTIMITPDYETQQGYTGTGKSTVTWILLAI